jgi:retron-type reverse transcriptase
MNDAKPSTNLLPKLLKVAERAKREPETRILALAQLVDVELMTLAYRRIRKDAAVGVDGVTKEQYGERMEDNLQVLYTRMRERRYRRQPIRRVHIPKAPGKTRPIGISTIEDKIVQNALTMVMEVLYEPVFLDCSYGFRPGRSAHDALRTVNAACMRGEVSWVLEADIASYLEASTARS